MVEDPDVISHSLLIQSIDSLGMVGAGCRLLGLLGVDTKVYIHPLTCLGGSKNQVELDFVKKSHLGSTTRGDRFLWRELRDSMSH